MMLSDIPTATRRMKPSRLRVRGVPVEQRWDLDTISAKLFEGKFDCEVDIGLAMFGAERSVRLVVEKEEGKTKRRVTSPC